MQVLAAQDGTLAEIYDRTKTAVAGEDGAGHILCSGSLLPLAGHYRFQPNSPRIAMLETLG